MPPVSQKKRLDKKLQRLSLFLPTPYERGGATAVGAAPLPGRTHHQPGRGCETHRARGGVPGDRGAGITSPASCLAHAAPHAGVPGGREARAVSPASSGSSAMAGCHRTGERRWRRRAAPHMRPISCQPRVAPQGWLCCRRLQDYHTRAWRPSIKDMMKLLSLKLLPRN
jgi:hypothetical protein